MWGNRSSFAIGSGGPAGTLTIRTPSVNGTISGIASRSMRVKTSTS